MNLVPNDLLVPIFRDARDMLLLTWAGVRAPSAAALDTAAALGRSIHNAERDARGQRALRARGRAARMRGRSDADGQPGAGPPRRAREHALPGLGYRLRPRARGPPGRGGLPSRLLECISRHPRLPAR